MACRQTLTSPEQARLSGEGSPEDGLLGMLRGVMNLDNTRVRRCTLLACSRRDGQRQEGSVTRKGASVRRTEKGPEGGNPRSDPTREGRKGRRGQRRQERTEL